MILLKLQTLLLAIFWSGLICAQTQDHKKELSNHWFAYGEEVSARQNADGDSTRGNNFRELYLKFSDNSTFEQIVFLDQEQLNTPAKKACEPRKDDYEVSYFKGRWTILKDTVILEADSEWIYSAGNFGNCFYYMRNSPPGFKCDKPPLRTCEIHMTRKFLLKGKELCELEPPYGCYK